MNKKKLLMFGLPLLAVVLVSAALLTYYGVITITANVSQSVIIDGITGQAITHTIPEAAPGGESFCFLHKVKNDASIDIPVNFVMNCTDTGDNTPSICEGVKNTVYEVPKITTLKLCEKNSSWQCIGSKTATLTFDTVNPKFKGILTTLGLETNTGYSLIYYPDKPNRFASDKWNGAGGKVIATFTGNQNNLAIDTDLGINLPNTDDWNINPSPDYCDNHNGFDDYNHCKGAKIWIVPTSDLTSGNLPLVAWNPSSYLFETDLITYSDCNFAKGLPDAVDMVEGASITSLDTKSKTTTPVLVCYDFDKLIAPGTYTITTTVVPQ